MNFKQSRFGFEGTPSDRMALTGDELVTSGGYAAPEVTTPHHRLTDLPPGEIARVLGDARRTEEAAVVTGPTAEQPRPVAMGVAAAVVHFAQQYMNRERS